MTTYLKILEPRITPMANIIKGELKDNVLTIHNALSFYNDSGKLIKDIDGNYVILTVDGFMTIKAKVKARK